MILDSALADEVPGLAGIQDPEPYEGSRLTMTGCWRRGRDELQQPVSLEAALRGWKAIPATGEG